MDIEKYLKKEKIEKSVSNLKANDRVKRKILDESNDICWRSFPGANTTWRRRCSGALSGLSPWRRRALRRSPWLGSLLAEAPMTTAKAQKGRKPDE